MRSQGRTVRFDGNGPPDRRRSRRQEALELKAFSSDSQLQVLGPTCLLSPPQGPAE
jgi:hypothetical protein